MNSENRPETELSAEPPTIGPPGRLAGESLVLRADGGPQIGTGHVMRCLALAQAWQDAGGKAVFAIAAPSPTLIERVGAEGISVRAVDAVPGAIEDVEQTSATAFRFAAQWVVLDGYHFGADFQSQLRQKGFRLLVVDDYGHAERYCADLVLNQNLGVSPEHYPRREIGTRLLLGTRYALLRREFWSWRNWRRQTVPIARNLLVTCGGADPNNVSERLLKAVAGVAEIETTFVVGGSNRHLDSLRAAAAGCPRIRMVVNATQMPQLMADADLALSAAGSTVWELAFLGVPSLLVVLADNQRNIARAAAGSGAAVDLGDGKSVGHAAVVDQLYALARDPARRAEMSRLGRQIVDGFGPTRVVTLMTKLRDGGRFSEGGACADCLPLQ